MAADKMKEILKHFPDLEDGWKEMEEKLKAEPAEREMLSLKYREMLQRDSSKESLVESEFTKAKMADSDLKIMKANEAPENMYIPEKIFLPYIDGKVIGLIKETGVPFKSGVDGNIEYTRTDAFIEKAEEYIYKQLNEGRIECGDIEKFIEEFKKAMKGE